MVIQKMRQLTTVMRASNFTSRSAVCNFASSARQPDFMTLWNTSIFQRIRVPVELFDGGCEIVDRQIGHEPPVDRVAIRRRVDFQGVNVEKGLWRVSLLFADGRQCLHRGKLDLQESDFVILAANRDLMATRPRDGGELGEDAMGRISVALLLSGVARPADWAPTRTRNRVPRSCARQKSS